MESIDWEAKYWGPTLAKALASADTLCVALVRQETNRARAAARARRNSPVRHPRVDQKRARETRFLPTWKDVA